MKIFVGAISVNPAEDEYCRSYNEPLHPVALPNRRCDAIVSFDS
jgi:hypothetical protein